MAVKTINLFKQRQEKFFAVAYMGQYLKYFIEFLRCNFIYFCRTFVVNTAEPFNGIKNVIIEIIHTERAIYFSQSRFSLNNVIHIFTPVSSKHLTIIKVMKTEEIFYNKKLFNI